MCGILSIINNKSGAGTENLVNACKIIRHRGPDDEGFLTWQPGNRPVVWAGADTAVSTVDHFGYDRMPTEQKFKVGFGHRRLSILDLSPTGHQPMLYPKASLAITYNGEIYNYLEIKAELQTIGHQFHSTSDTEVILHAWEQWGPRCLDKFNGMFAFVLLDYNKNELYAVRDRFGIKPLYYYKGAKSLYIASEIKQVRTAPGYQLKLNEPIARQFLATGAVDHTEQTFDVQIRHLPGGHYLYMDLNDSAGTYTLKKWYTLVPKKWDGNFDAAANELKKLLTDSVRLRLRSDVKVGSCLSGGLDSSSIVCIAADLLKAEGDFAGQETVTACYKEAKYDEWQYAEEVIRKTNAHPHQTFPTFEQLEKEIDAFLWHQDEPTGSTSQFSQWAVFKATHEAGLKVMIDGQGADEQLAGYGGNDMSLYAGLLGNRRLRALYSEARHYKTVHGTWPKGFLLGAMQIRFGKKFTSLLPQRLHIRRATVSWLRNTEPANIHPTHAGSLQENLLRQLYNEPLPALLRYEDHNSMAWSIESRTPFLDYRIVEFTMGLPEDFIYKHGLRKRLLRKAMHQVIPEAIENRTDKMGFVTPEELWLKGEGRQWFTDGVERTLQLLPEMFDGEKVRQLTDDTLSGAIPFDFTLWRILSFGKWYAQLNAINNQS